MTIGRGLLSKAETVTLAAIEAGVPALVEAREIIAEFHMIIRRKAEAGLTPWIERARASLVASFASGVARDEAAVRAAITLPWSNGQTEGQITSLKLVGRQKYGRGKIDPSGQTDRRMNELHQNCIRALFLPPLTAGS
jgi:transposase